MFRGSEQRAASAYLLYVVRYKQTRFPRIRWWLAERRHRRERECESVTPIFFQSVTHLRDLFEGAEAWNCGALDAKAVISGVPARNAALIS